jgi:hypothetical protein
VTAHVAEIASVRRDIDTLWVHRSS